MLHFEVYCYANEVLLFPLVERPLRFWSVYKSRSIFWSDFQDLKGRLIHRKIRYTYYVLLIATETEKTRNTISNSLGMVYPVIIAVNPNRKNIFYTAARCQQTGDDKIEALLLPYITKTERSYCILFQRRNLWVMLPYVSSSLVRQAVSALIGSANLAKN